MELRIQSINFDASEQLKAFAKKKVEKLERYTDEIIQSEMIMKVIKPDARLQTHLKSQSTYVWRL